MLNNVRLLTHSSIRIELENGKIVYVDPYEIQGEPNDADYILITHSHYDHFSPKDIAKVMKLACPNDYDEENDSYNQEDEYYDGTDFDEENANDPTKVFMPYDPEQDALGLEIINVEPGEDYSEDDFYVETTYAYNVGKDFHPKDKGWVGYLIDTGSETIYIAGDTDANEDIMDIECDVAMVPIGGTYTMNPSEAAEFVNTIKPILAIPTHYGSVVGEEEYAEAFEDMLDPEITVLYKKEY